jgi:hypothetical protein
MAFVTVKDHVIWIPHVVGNDGLREKLEALEAGDAIKIIVDGQAGTCVRMNDDPSGRPTHGLKPVGKTKTQWAELYATRRGQVIELIAT